ncbi:MAG: glycosyltransferase [Ruminococcus flavefaciens]|nr:glycosyltransferase [Roseburia sp.]MCM1231451.1 glycosyltransferase [Ruminococcus flavefaciens]
MEELVSVVIPVYNREKTIKRAIDSVLNQTYSNIEVIVVDDCSTDHSIKVVNEYADQRVRVICQKQHGGANRARNVGIINAKGVYIAFQDSDDEWLPDKLYLQIELIKTTRLLACYCPYYLYEKGVVLPIPYDYADLRKYQENLCDILSLHNVVGTPTLIIRRELLDLLGNQYFDEHMSRWQDYEFVIRIAKCTKIGYVNTPLVNAYRVENSITSDRSKLYAAVAQLIKKHKDFVSINNFLEEFITYCGVEYDTEEILIEGLDKIQDAIGNGDIIIKNLVLAHFTRGKRVERNIRQKEFNNNVAALKDKHFYIYGAGKIGQKCYQNLNSKGLCPKSFIVSQCEKREYICGIPVISIDECEDKESMVIIGIAKTYQAELIENLTKRNFSLFCIYPY